MMWNVFGIERDIELDHFFNIWFTPLRNVFRDLQQKKEEISLSDMQLGWFFDFLICHKNGRHEPTAHNIKN